MPKLAYPLAESALMDSYYTAELHNIYLHMAMDIVCEQECGGSYGGCCVVPCETVKDYQQELIDSNTCQECGKLLAPSDYKYTVPGVGVFCSVDEARLSLE